MSTEAQEIFITSLKDVELELTEIGFSHASTIKKGYATYSYYKRADNIQVLFMYRPSDWDVELSLTKDERKYELKDLLKIPSIFKWVIDNKFQHRTREKIKDEVAWFIELLRFIIKTETLT